MEDAEGMEAVTAIRFDADKDKVVRGVHSYDKSERDGWRGGEETLWYLTDGNSNGRWLYVDRPDNEGEVEVGILRVYRKHLSPAAARGLASVLLKAAEAGEAIQTERKAEQDSRDQRVRECEENGGHQWGPPPLTTSHATGAVWSDGTTTRSSSFRACRRCDDTAWFDDAPVSPG